MTIDLDKIGRLASAYAERDMKIAPVAASGLHQTCLPHQRSPAGKPTGVDAVAPAAAQLMGPTL